MKKSIESEYQSVFNQDHIESEDWNMPSDNVWTNIEQEIKKEKRKKIFFWYWLPSIVLLGGLGLFWKKMPTNKTSLTTSLSSIIGKEKTITKNENIVKSNTFKTIDNQSIIKENTEYKPKYTLAVLNKNISQKNTFLPKEIESSKKDLAQNEAKNIDLATTTKIISNDIKNTEIREALEIENLPLLPFSLLSNESSETPIFAKAIIEKRKQKFKPSLFLTAFQMNVVNRVVGTVPEFNGESLLSARGVGLALQQKITKRTFVEIGMQYAELNYQLKYDLGLPFNNIGETKTQNGDYANKYNGAVPTTFGELKMEMVLERKANVSVPNGETIPLSAEGKETLRFIRLPISIGYVLFDNHKNLTISAKATTTQTLNFSTRTVFNTVVSHHSAVDETLTAVQESPKPKRWTPEIGAGMMFYYRLSPRWQIGAEGFFSQSIRPVYENNFYKNIPLFYGFGLNTSYKF